MTALERDWVDHMILMASASADTRVLPLLAQLRLPPQQLSEIAAQGDGRWRDSAERLAHGTDFSPRHNTGDPHAQRTR